MHGMLAIFGATAGGALYRGLNKHYQQWKIDRADLPDEVREEIFWNDRRYARLRLGMKVFLDTVIVLGVIGIAFMIWVLAER